MSCHVKGLNLKNLAQTENWRILEEGNTSPSLPLTHCFRQRG